MNVSGYSPPTGFEDNGWKHTTPVKSGMVLSIHRYGMTEESVMGSTHCNYVASVGGLRSSCKPIAQSPLACANDGHGCLAVYATLRCVDFRVRHALVSGLLRHVGLAATSFRLTRRRYKQISAYAIQRTNGSHAANGRPDIFCRPIRCSALAESQKKTRSG